MNSFSIVPAICEFPDFAAFAAGFSLTEKDLILTNAFIYEPLRARCPLPCRVIFQEDYGLGEPSDVMVNGILAEAARLQPQRVIGVGGGSVMDIAKILAVAGDCTELDALYERMGSLARQRALILIPSTCGSGSEMTNIAIVNRSRLGTKQGLVSPAMYADAAVLIPELLQTLPYPVFATSSIDALIHAIESFLSPQATAYSRLFSEQAIRSMLAAYRRLAEDPAALPAIYAEVLRAANLAGIAFGNAGCGAVHALSYALGGKYHVPHGESNYQFLLPVLRLYHARGAAAMTELETLLAGCLAAEDGLAALAALLEKILPARPMRSYGASEADIIPFAASTAANQQRLLARSCLPLSEEDLRQIYADCLDG